MLPNREMLPGSFLLRLSASVLLSISPGAMKRNGNDAENGSEASKLSRPSHSSHPSHDPERLLPPRGDYQTLLSFKKAEVVYDLTFRFAHKYLARGDRTVDQMIQAARSGKKNLLEGSKADIARAEV